MYLANQSYIQFRGHPCIHGQETGWQSAVRMFLMLELHVHLVQELNIGTVYYRVTQEFNLQYGHLIPALNAWAARALNTQPHIRITQFSGH